MDFTALASKTTEPTAGGGLNQVYFALASDIAQFPDRDAQNKAVISGNITFNTGKGWNLLYVTRDEQQLKEEGVDMRDNDAISSTFEAHHPGLAETFRQFVAEHGKDEFYLLIFDCAKQYPILFGRKCSPASMKISIDSGKAVGDRKGNTMTFNSDGPYPCAIYKGAFNPANTVILADETVPDVEDGSFFVTSANTAATAITDLDNASVGSTIILAGGSSTNASTIANTGNFSLTAAMTLTTGAYIQLYVRGAHDFVELSRG